MHGPDAAVDIEHPGSGCVFQRAAHIGVGDVFRVDGEDAVFGLAGEFVVSVDRRAFDLRGLIGIERMQVQPRTPGGEQRESHAQDPADVACAHVSAGNSPMAATKRSRTAATAAFAYTAVR